MQQLLEKSEFRLGGRDRERLFDAGEAHSLDDVITRLSQGLSVRGNAACLVCGGDLRPRRRGRGFLRGVLQLRQQFRVAPSPHFLAASECPHVRGLPAALDHP